MKKTIDYIDLKHPIEKELYLLFGKNEKLIIFDIGCCELEDSIRYSNMFSQALIYSFEALYKNYLISNENLSQFKKQQSIHLFNVALSNTEGEADFYISSGKPQEHIDIDFNFGNKSSSLLEPKKVKDFFNWLEFNEIEKVKTKKINDFCIEQSITLLDLLHIDVQGAEMLVLEGANYFLNNTRAIWIEVETEELYKSQPLKNDIEIFLKKFGFFPAKIMVEGIAGDILFLNKKYFDEKILTPTNNKISLFESRLSNKFLFKKQFQQISYSQTGEDILIKNCLEFFKIKTPSYIDIGANHPFHYNNTALFYDKGSLGINIEPNTKLFKLFEKYRKNDVNLNIGISDVSGELDYFEFDSETLNTCSEVEALNYEKLGYSIKNKKKIKVYTISEIIKTHHNNIFPDILTIDVEGLDEKILKSIDFNTNYPKIICVETVKFDIKFDLNNKSDSILKYLTTNGYSLYADTFINTILIKK